MTVELREVTRDNLREILGLAVAPEQRGLVADNARSIAQAHFEPNAWFRAVYVDDEPVGFVQGIDPPGERFTYVWRVMIDAAHQGRGHGAAAMRLIIDRARGLDAVDRVVLSHSDAAGNAGPFYERLGFKPTGELDDGEVVLALELGAGSEND